MKNLIKKKKAQGNFGLLFAFFILVAIIMAIGFFAIILSSVVNYSMDIIVPTIEGVGDLGGANMTVVAGYTLNPLNTLVQSFTWIAGAMYFICFFGLFGISLAHKFYFSRWMIPLFFLMAVLMIFASMFMSNMYQDMYNGSDDLSLVMREHGLLSWLILHQPVIFTVVIFTSGIIMFSGMSDEDLV